MNSVRICGLKKKKKMNQLKIRKCYNRNCYLNSLQVDCAFFLQASEFIVIFFVGSGISDSSSPSQGGFFTLSSLGLAFQSYIFLEVRLVYVAIKHVNNKKHEWGRQSG